MKLSDCNPYVRAAQIQPSILERTGLRKAYDHRIFYILENKGKIVVNDVCWDVEPDTVIIIPPAVAYDFIGELKVCVLNFDMSRSFSNQPEPLFPPCVDNFNPAFLYDTELLEGFEHPRIYWGNYNAKQSILKIVDVFNSKGLYSDEITSAQLKMFLTELLMNEVTSENKLSEKIVSYIYTNAATIIDNADVARHFGYHSVYLSQLLKRSAGKALHTIIIEAKLSIACQLLLGTDKKVDEIVHLAGFNSRTYFATLFKKKFGVSPAVYRKSNIYQQL